MISQETKINNISEIIKNFYAKGRAFDDLDSFIKGALDKSSGIEKVVCRTYDESFPAVFCKKLEDGKFNFSIAAKHQDPEYINLGEFEGKSILSSIKEFVKQENLEAQKLGKWYGHKEDSPNVCMR
jgi:hypothetical protein